MGVILMLDRDVKGMALTSVNSWQMVNCAQISEKRIIFGHCVIPEELHQLHPLHLEALRPSPVGPQKIFMKNSCSIYGNSCLKKKVSWFLFLCFICSRVAVVEGMHRGADEKVVGAL